MPRKNVPGGRKSTAKTSSPDGEFQESRRKKTMKNPKFKNKSWLDDIDDFDEDYDIFDRDTESE